MNDEEIINEINEILVYLEDEGEYHLDKDCDTEWLLAVKEVLNLFNRHQAEIERFTSLLVQWKKVAYKYADSIEKIKTEARKEFAAELISALKIDEFSWFEEESERLVKAINELAEGSEIKCQ